MRILTNEDNNRVAAHDIDSVYLKRWSPRSFANKDVDQPTLNSLFEAARWAPSAANIQPWQFIYAKSAEDRETFLSFIKDGNISWCKHAPVLIAVVSKCNWPKGNDLNPTHAFDTGTAWGYLALEAARKGLIAHAMGGFNREKAKQVLLLPENYQVHAIVAVGYQGYKESLNEKYHEREIPSNRKAIEEFIYEGKFKSTTQE